MSDTLLYLIRLPSVCDDRPRFSHSSLFPGRRFISVADVHDRRASGSNLPRRPHVLVLGQGLGDGGDFPSHLAVPEFQDVRGQHILLRGSAFSSNVHLRASVLPLVAPRMEPSMSALATHRNRFITFAAGALIALAVLTPTGAEAVPTSLKATSSDSNVTGSCQLTTTRYNYDGTNTVKLVMKAAEIKPTFFAPRRVSTIVITCVAYPFVNDPEGSLYFQKINNGSTVYKAQYITLPTSGQYQVCADTQYVLKSGSSGYTSTVCNPVWEG
jgi:hypothetical protein